MAKLVFMPEEKVLAAVKAARENSKQRKFKQTFSLSINLKNLDMKKPDSKIKTEIILPHGLSEGLKVGIFADALLPQAKAIEGVSVIRRDEIDSYGKNKKAMKIMAGQCWTFLAEAPLMPSVGKAFGPVLAVRNKMPKPIPPQLPNLKGAVDVARKTVRVALKESPVVQVPVGSEDFDDNKIAENIEAVIKAIETAAPKGKENLRNAYLKLTMGKPVKLELR